MSGKLPRGFSMPTSKDTKAGASGSKARPTDKREGKKAVEVPDSKKRSSDTLASVLPKKLKPGEKGVSAAETTLTKPGEKGAPFQVSDFFGPISSPFISEHILQRWQSQSAEDQEQSMIRASAQLTVQTIERAQRNREGKAAFAKLQAENKRLSELVAEDAKQKKDLDASRAEARRLREEVKELKGVAERYVSQTSLVEKLKAEQVAIHKKIDSLEEEKLDWEVEMEALYKTSFMSGFNCYLINFLAQDPDYDWSKFGPGCVEDIAVFKIEHAEEILAERIKLGLEGASGEIPSIAQPSTSTTPAPPPDNLEIPPPPTDEKDESASLPDASQVDAPQLP